ncbi:undecaprenyl diphosphate synthase [Trichococcus patagoniensis]|uniref:Isoprenyl transferase n=1 Tax=Trichococcus patagoniensis TaxID=382641 RepID=A0A2T5IKA1_9LACT|nr:isoprenyl transferase [Trichococcus patagoniensis]PTQ84247.1 undecaprenyl diphosphate synthase [Trichococcus patagoniensis]
MALFKSENPKTEMPFDENGIVPAHVAIIMDGNGRWAKKKLMPRVYGHKEGMNTVKRIAIEASGLDVKVLTLYAFSTENWKRPTDEVNFLMGLPIDFFDVFMPELMQNNIKVTTIGWIDQLPEKTLKVVQNAIEKTKDNTGLILNFALNYGSRAEILQATKMIARDVATGKLSEDEITDEVFSGYLFTSVLGEWQDPDLLIRTSGEIRLSNFLLWQAAYSEMYFTEEFWPDFSTTSLRAALAEYQHRNRRFGGI